MPLSHLYRPIKIGSYTSKGNLFMAPIAGYSDVAFRSICTSSGCDLAYTEMVSAEALIRNHSKTNILLKREANEIDYAVQLFGANYDSLSKAAKIVESQWHPVIIDLNCGCPVPKIIKTGAGSALMQTPNKLADIIKAMTDAVSVPITVKIRLGEDNKSMNYIDIAQTAVKAGAAAICLHARTKKQGYSGKAEWNAFYTLAKSIEVPVFASGDMFSAQDAIAVLQEGYGNSASGAISGVMFARGAIGNSFIFAQTKAAIENKALDISALDRINAARDQLKISVKYYGERHACIEFRKHAAAWLNGRHCQIAGLAELRKQAVTCSSVNEYEAFFAAWETAVNKSMYLYP